MIDYSKMSKLELASFICSKLKENDIEVVLSGGACVEIYSKGNYTSLDIDLINRYNETFRKIKIVMEDLCFTEKEKYFIHENTEYDLNDIKQWSIKENSLDKFEIFIQKLGK